MQNSTYIYPSLILFLLFLSFFSFTQLDAGLVFLYFRNERVDGVWVGASPAYNMAVTGIQSVAELVFDRTDCTGFSIENFWMLFDLYVYDDVNGLRLIGSSGVSKIPSTSWLYGPYYYIFQQIAVWNDTYLTKGKLIVGVYIYATGTQYGQFAVGCHPGYWFFFSPQNFYITGSIPAQYNINIVIYGGWWFCSGYGYRVVFAIGAIGTSSWYGATCPGSSTMSPNRGVTGYPGQGQQNPPPAGMQILINAWSLAQSWSIPIFIRDMLSTGRVLANLWNITINIPWFKLAQLWIATVMSPVLKLAQQWGIPINIFTDTSTPPPTQPDLLAPWLSPLLVILLFILLFPWIFYNYMGPGATPIVLGVGLGGVMLYLAGYLNIGLLVLLIIALGYILWRVRS